MYDIIFLVIALIILIVVVYQMMKKYKKKKEGFTISGSADGSLLTTSISDPSTYISQLTTIISNTKTALNLDTNRDSYAEILALQSELIQLCLLSKFLNFNLNYSDDFLIFLSQTALQSSEYNGWDTGASVALSILDSTNSQTSTASILSSIMTY
jgi:hypothetical protein